MFWQRFYELCCGIGSKPNPVGKKLEIASSTITQWKQGALPSGENLIKLADFFGCSIDYLLGRAETHEISNSAQTVKEQQLINAYKHHPELQPAIDKLLGIEELDNGDKLIFRAARSADNHPAEITVLTKEEQERIEKAPKVTSENSDL